jgi:hypothetical protein
MNSLTIFLIQLTLSILVVGLLSKWYLLPWLATKPLRVALTVLLLPHVTRHVGLSFLVPGLVDPALPDSFATSAAYGDLLSGLLALLALAALHGRWSLALPLVWVFSLVGTVDLVVALTKAYAVPFLGATWFIPTFLVPVLLVTHALVFTRLIHRARNPESSLVAA